MSTHTGEKSVNTVIFSKMGIIGDVGNLIMRISEAIFKVPGISEGMAFEILIGPSFKGRDIVSYDLKIKVTDMSIAQGIRAIIRTHVLEIFSTQEEEVKISDPVIGTLVIEFYQ